MKKYLSAMLLVLLAFVAGEGSVLADGDIYTEKIINPAASVYTHWGDATQTSAKYNYHYVLWADGQWSSSTNAYWTEPNRALFYRFDLSSFVTEGCVIEKAVILQDGPTDNRMVRLIDCPENTLAYGQNYLTVPQLQMQNSFLNYDIPSVNIGAANVSQQYQGARAVDDCAVDITSYVSRKLSSGNKQFTFAMYPYYGTGTQIYMKNHVQLYIKVKMPHDSLVFLHCGKSNQLNVSGTAYTSNIGISVKDSEGELHFSKTLTFGENEEYYHCSFDMNGMEPGIYTVMCDFEGNEVTKQFNYQPLSQSAGTIYTSVDYPTSTVRIHGKMNQSQNDPVMLTVLNPGYDESALDTPGAVRHIEVKDTIKGQYEFKIGMDSTADYRVIIQGIKGEVRSSFRYNPEEYEPENEIDKYTATYYAPWLLNWHMTKQNQWEAGYYGGEACQMCWSLEICPTNSQLMLVGTDTNGIWKSEDGGTSWRSTSAGFNCMGTADIAFDPENESIVYALGSTGTGNYDEPYTGIYKSYDGGDTWERIFYNKYYRVKNNKIILFGQRNPSGVRRIFVGGHGKGAGPVYSDDDGASWQSLGDGEFADKITRDICISGDALILATSSGLYASHNNGTSFTDISPVSGGSYTVTVDPADSAHLICARGNYLHETTDSGESWTLINTFPREAGQNLNINSVRYGYGASPRLYVCVGLAHFPLRYSTDHGRSFVTPVKSNNSTEFIINNSGWGAEPFALDPNNANIVMVSLDGELYKSTDGGETYFASSSGYSGMRASDFLFDDEDDGNIYIASIDRGIVKTVDSEQDEKYPLIDYSASEDSTGIRYGGSKTTLAVARDPKNPNRIIICIGSGSNYVLKQSYDGGSAGSYEIIAGTEGFSTGHIEFNQDNPNTIYAGKLISYDNGITWTESAVKVAAVSPFNGSTVYGINGNLIARSFDEGRTWKSYSSYIGGVQRLICDLFEDGTVYASTYSALARINSSGTPEYITPKINKSGEGTGYFGLAIAQDPKNGMHLVTGGTDNIDYGRSGGIFETYDGGVTWRIINGMPASRDIWDMEFHPNLPRVYIATSAGTFVYEFEKYDDEKIALTDKTLEISGGIANYSMNMWNTDDMAHSSMLIASVCDRQTGAVKKLAISYCDLKATSRTPVNIEIETDENSVLKVYVWDNKLAPLNSKYDWRIIGDSQ